MTRTVVERPNGDAPDRDVVHVVLPNSPAFYSVIFDWGLPEQVVRTHHRRVRHRDFLDRARQESVQAITRIIWDGGEHGDNMTPRVREVIADAERQRAEAHPVYERAARLLDVSEVQPVAKEACAQPGYR